MPFHSPISNDDGGRRQQGRQSGGQGGGMKSLVQAERLMQIAFMLPCAMVLGWAAGWTVDHFFHQHWAIFAGLVLGIVAGMVGAVRMAKSAMDSLSKSGRE